MADGTAKGPVTAGMLELGKEIRVGDCRVRLGYDEDRGEPPWDGIGAFVPVLLFEGDGNMNFSQIGAGHGDDWLGGGGLDMVPLEVLAKQRDRLLDMVCDTGEKVADMLGQLEEYAAEYRQTYRNRECDDREILREFLWMKMDEVSPLSATAKFRDYHRPYDTVQEHFAFLEGIYWTVGIPASEFRKVTRNGVACCLVALTPRWCEAAHGDAAYPVSREMLEKEAEEFAALYRKWRDGEVYSVDVLSPTGDRVDACGGFYDLEEAAAFASETVVMYDNDAEADPEP